MLAKAYANYGRNLGATMALSDHWSEWSKEDCRDAVALIQRQRGALEKIASMFDWQREGSVEWMAAQTAKAALKE
jgi:hypothetical protein